MKPPSNNTPGAAMALQARSQGNAHQQGFLESLGRTLQAPFKAVDRLHESFQDSLQPQTPAERALSAGLIPYSTAEVLQGNQSQEQK